MAEKQGLPPVEVPPQPSPIYPPPSQPAYPPAAHSQMQPGPAGPQPAQMTATGYPPQPMLAQPAQIATAGYPQLPPQNVVYQAQPQIIQAGTSTVVVQTAPKPPAPPMSAAYARSFTILGAVQIVVGCLCFVFNVIGQASDMESFYVGAGYWAGGLFILTGVFGVLSGKKKTNCGSPNCYVVTFMILSILMPSLFVVAVLCQASFGIAMRKQCEWRCDPYDTYDCRCYYDSSKEHANIAWNSLLIIAAAVELVSSIVSSAYCCGFLCCRKYLTGQVQYVQGQQLFLSGQPQGQQFLFSGQPIPQQGQQFVLSAQPLQQQAQQLVVPGQTIQQQQQQTVILSGQAQCMNTGPSNQQKGSAPGTGNLSESPPPAYSALNTQ